jgi:hypothetical protein
VASTFDQFGFETIQINSLADLDRLVSERFILPLRPYSTDIRAALELVIWDLENSDYPHFEMFRYEKDDFTAGFQKDAWGSASSAPLAICLEALRYLRKVRVTIHDNG